MGTPRQENDDTRTARRALALAEAALGHWEMRDARLSTLSLGYKHVFRVSCPGGEEFVLRTYGLPDVDEETLRRSPELRTGAGLRSPETLRAQLAWLAALGADEGLRVPEPVPALDGSLLARIHRHGERFDLREAPALPRWD